MNPLASLALLIATAAITPGPNNFVLFSEAAERGVWRTVPVIVAIAASGVAMLLAAWAIVSVAHLERLLPFVGLVGCVMLAAMAIQQLRPESGEGHVATPRVAASTVALLQPANPKAWTLVAVVVSAARSSGVSFGLSALLIAGISSMCSLCWTMLGRFVSRLAGDRSRHVIRRVLAATLLAQAMYLSYQQLGVIL